MKKKKEEKKKKCNVEYNWHDVTTRKNRKGKER